MLRKLLSQLRLGVFIIPWATLAGSAFASTVANVCATPGNVCAAGVATINVLTTITCSSTLDFETETIPGPDPGPFPQLVINAGGDLKTTGASACVTILNVETLVVKGPSGAKPGGKITHPALSASAKPGKIIISADASPPATAITVEKGGQITVSGGAGLPHPTIELTAAGHININGLLQAAAITTAAEGGHIITESQEGKVTVGSQALLVAQSTSPGGTFIDIKACAGIEIFGVLNATAAMHGAEVHLFSREGILIKNGKVLADMSTGGLLAGQKQEVTMEARDFISLESSTVRANTGGTGAKGGVIKMLSTEGEISCVAGSIMQVNAIGGGSSGGEVNLQSFEDLTYNCAISAQGNTTTGVGGKILFQSFNQDVMGNGNVNATGKTKGSITLTACANPITDGGTFTPAPFLTPGFTCVAAPTVIPPCSTVCFCLKSFRKSTIGNILTIKGNGLQAVQVVEFEAGCNPTPNSGPQVTKTAFLSQSDDKITLSLVGVPAGTYNIVLSDATAGPSSSCSIQLLTIP